MSTSTKKYIAVDSENTNADVVKLTNPDNEFTGTLKTTLNGVQEPADVKDLFLAGVKVNGEDVVPTQESDGCWTVDLNNVVTNVVLKGTDDEELPAVVENGTATIQLDEIQFGNLNVDSLYVDGNRIQDMIPDMESIKGIAQLDGANGASLDEVIEKVNTILATLKQIADLQQGGNDHE